MKICRLGPIVKHMNGVGFTVVFDTVKEAKEYKNMNDVIIKHGGYRVYDKKGFHEKEE